MRILAIETSCDDTAIAILEVTEGVKPASTKVTARQTKFKTLGSEVSSQIAIHIPYGGVFPSLAKREHIKNLPIVLEKVLKQAKIVLKETCPVRSREGSQRVSTSNGIDAIAVTTGPGLEPALWTGIVFAKELHTKYKIPIVKVNHMEGHIFSIFPKDKKTFTVSKEKENFPMLSLLVSGGHTELVLIKDWQKYKKIGQTRDDASGEAFDKVARMLGLPYPGGPEVSKLASIERKCIVPGSLTEADGPSTSKKFSRILLRADGNNILSKMPAIILPRPMIYSKDYDFSFSGLKTAVLYLIRDLQKEHSDILQNDKIKQMIAKEFEDAVVETLVHKTIKAIKQYKIKTLIVGGGVSANKYLQEVMKREVKKLVKSDFTRIKVHFPSRSLTGDNALMIAIAGYYQAKDKKFVKNINTIKAKGNLSL